MCMCMCMCMNMSMSMYGSPARMLALHATCTPAWPRQAADLCLFHVTSPAGGGGWGRWVGGCGLASMSRHAARASSRMAASASSNIASTVVHAILKTMSLLSRQKMQFGYQGYRPPRYSSRSRDHIAAACCRSTGGRRYSRSTTTHSNSLTGPKNISGSELHVEQRMAKSWCWSSSAVMPASDMWLDGYM